MSTLDKPTQDLIDAINNGDFNAIRDAVEEGADVHIPNDESDGTILINAIGMQSEDPELPLTVVTYLVEECGADVNQKDFLGMPPLFYAAYGKDERITAYLVERGADIHFGDDKAGASPIMAAAAYGSIQNIETLLELGADINQQDLKGGTPLSRALLLNNFGVLDCLLQHGADPFLADDQGATPLMWLEGRKCICLHFSYEELSFVHVNESGTFCLDCSKLADRFRDIMNEASWK